MPRPQKKSATSSGSSSSQAKSPTSLEKTSKAHRGEWVKCMTAQGTIRAVAIQATEVADVICGWHRLQGAARDRLSEAVVAALCVAAYGKSEEHVNLNIRGTGLIRQAIVDATTEGRVRGYVIQGEPISDDRGPWGEGLLAVLRSKSNVGGTPYIGTVPLLTGFLAKDMTYYWHQSEQVPTAVGLTVRPDRAYGFLIQAVPGCNEADLAWIEQGLKSMPEYIETMDSGTDPVHLLSQLFLDRPFTILERRTLEAKCECSMDRAERVLKLVGSKEVDVMIQMDQFASVTCDFCSTEYRVDLIELRQKF